MHFLAATAARCLILALVASVSAACERIYPAEVAEFDLPKAGVVDQPVCVVVFARVGCGSFKGIDLDVDDRRRVVNLSVFGSEPRFYLVLNCLPIVGRSRGSATFTPHSLGAYTVTASFALPNAGEVQKSQSLSRVVLIEDLSAMGRVPVGCNE